MVTYLNPESILNNSISKEKLSSSLQTEIDDLNTRLLALEQSLLELTNQILN